jgi:23S rRNA (cytosine1962-C5)-methyltransferase
LKKITLKRGKEDSLQRFHPWVFSGAIARADEGIAEGEVVDVVSAAGELLARGHWQVGSIAVRVLTFADEKIDVRWWETRLREAYTMRSALGLTDNPRTTCYRLVHGEGDFLPGLVVDIYGSTAVLQAHSAGMFLAREQVVKALHAVYGGRLTAVYDKSAQTAPFKAGLGAVDGYLWRADEPAATASGGDAPTQDPQTVFENGHAFLVDWQTGQKSGFFIDQRDSRALVEKYAPGRTVLNTFCYTGGFSVYALAGGAKSVDSVDSSKTATDLAARNVELNAGPGAPHRAITGDAMEFVRASAADDYDLIILDPPAFAKHRGAIPAATVAYRRLNAEAIARIRPGGILFTFSCSQAISRELFRTTVFSAAAIAHRRVRILHQLTQPADHPVSIFHPEGEYLKGLVLYIE